MMNKRFQWFAAATATAAIATAATIALGVSTASAQGIAPAAGAHAGHHGDPAASTPDAGAPKPAQAGPSMHDMDHGDMSMQGGSAPADARDPNAYSNGYTLGAGKYSLGPGQRLRMADEHNFGALLMNRLEYANGRDDHGTAYDLQAWFGRDYNRLVIKAEGEAARGTLQHARTELLWGHAIASYWDTQLGARHDSGIGPDRSWLAFGVQGLAPYWFHVDATAYLGSSGRTALRLEAEYEILITQRLIVQPRAEFNVYGKSDPEAEIGSGVSNAALGLRLRYEFTRQFAPYIGVEWANTFGRTANMVRASGERAQDVRFVAGVRAWF